jgi:glutamine synthetase
MSGNRHSERARGAEVATTFLAAHPDVETIDLLVTDANGIMRGKRVRRDVLPKVFEQGVCLPGSLFAADISGETVEASGLGFDRGDADEVCFPVPETLTLTGWERGADAQVIITMHTPGGAPFFADPRQVLARTLRRFDALGFTPVVAVELEFYLLDRERDGRGGPQPPCSPVSGRRERSTQVYGITELDDYSAFLAEVDRLASAQGLPADTAVAEYAPGQYEVNLHHVPDALVAADHAVLLKRVIRRAAEACGMAATFMAKPYADQAGSGTHVHVSLLDEDGRNVFAADEATGSPLLGQAAAGLLVTMPEAIALLAPNVNSMRRFQPDNFVPLVPCWGVNNRTAAVRIPAGGADARRLEHRVAGADANPYLATAAVLAGMHHGLANGLTPPPPAIGNAAVEGAVQLPASWLHAIESLERGTVLPDYLDPEFVRVYLACRRHERERFHRSITPLEHEWYLSTV